jgi:peptide chain release factor 1
MSVDKRCFAEFSGETGVHRVQRVPQTESQGRIHTSTVSVAVIPQKNKDNNILDEKDIRMDVYRSSGPGGQNVNKTNSAVRLVHVPTGITVCMQDERSQIENKIRAFKVLKTRIEERARIMEQQNTKAIRTEQVYGTAL